MDHERSEENRRLRRTAFLGALLSLSAFAVFLGLAYEVSEGATRGLDVALLLRVHSTFPRWLEPFLIAVTTLGYYSVVIVLLAIVIFLFYRRGLRSYALYLPICAFGGMGLATTVKDSVDRVRPHLFHFANYPIPSSYSFTSGHATMAVVFYGVLSLLLARRLRGWRRWSLVGLGVILALLIGFSRLYLGVHYPSDVLGGYLLGTFWSAAVGTAFAFWRLRFGKP